MEQYQRRGIGTGGEGGGGSLNASKVGWINRHNSTSNQGGNGGISSSVSTSTLAQSASINSNLAALNGGNDGYSWKLTKAVLKNGTLNIYRPPADLSIKAFDPTIGGGNSSSTLGPLASGSTLSIPSHKRIASSVSVQSSSPLLLSYKGFDVHPDVVFDSQGKIVNGSLEAICHSILFGDDEEFSITAVLTIPLLGDVVLGLEIMKEYVSNIRGNHNNGANAELISNRVKLVIDTMLNNFKGMLLNNSIHASLQQLADSVSSYNDQISTALKLSIYQKHQRMNKMLSYTREDTEVLWSMHQKVTDSMSERLQAFMGRIDSSIGNESIQSRHGYHSSSLSIPPVTIPPDLFIELTATDFLATQISCFHLKFYKQWSPAIDISLLFKTNYNYHRYNPLIFDSNNLHFLGVLLIDHLLSPKYAKLLDDAYRGKVLTHWINLGNSLKSLGDLVGWIAIVTVVCSPQILRLRRCWSFVPIELRENVGKDWGHELFELDRRAKMDLMSKRTFRVSTEDIGVSYPKERSISFFGDLLVKPDENMTYKLGEERVNRVKTVINSWEYFFDRIPQNDTFGPPPQPNAAIQKLLHSLLVNNYETTQLTAEDILKLSLVIEPPKFGNYLKSHYSQQSPLMTGSYLPLIFTDTNPSYKLFTKASLISALSGISISNPSSSSKKLSRSGTTRSSEGGNIPSSASTNFYSHSGHTILSTTSTLTTAKNPLPAGNLHRSNSFPPSNSKSTAMTTGVKDIDFFSREFVAKYASQHTLMKNIRDVLNMGAKLYHINDDIVVKSLSEDYNSRPSSMIEAPSKHLSTSSRRVSTQFSSTVSPRTSVNGGTTDFSKVFEHFSSSVSVVVKSSNLERLVDILVLGVNGFASFVNKQDIDGNTPEFRIDMNVHTLTFFATFRSFCSPLELLSSLKKRFVGAKSAALSIVNLGKEEAEEDGNDDIPFPNWDPNCDIELTNNRAWGIVAQIQIGVLEACHLWVLQYFSDFADNLTLKEQFLELIDIFNNEISNWKLAKQQVNEDYNSYLESMEIIYKKVRNLFYKKSYRANDVYAVIPTYPIGFTVDNLPLGNTNSCNIKLEKFIEDINIITSEYLGMINIKEWIEIFEAFEVQSSEINGFFNYNLPSYSNDDDVFIQDIFTFLESLYKESNGEKIKLIDQFPQALQALFQLRHNIISYLLYQIYDPNIHKDARVQRMVSILKIIGICKARMKFLDLFPKEDDEELVIGKSNDISTSVPSFLESCVISTILRPESRLFANSWIQASKEINKMYNKTTPNSFINLEVFIPTIHKEDLVSITSKKSLSPCIGWTFERMFEIVCYVPNMSVENCSLINFDKRRFIYNLITNVSEMKGEIEEDETIINNGSSNITSSAGKRIAYIVNPDKSLYLIDRRTLKDTIIKDTKEYPRSYSKNKVFTSYINLEIEKLKRDNRQKEYLERQYRDLKKSSKHKYGISSSGGSILGVDKKPPRSRFGGLLKAVRPISMAFSGTFIPPSDRIVSVNDLPEMSSINDMKCKLLASINLANCEIVTPNHQLLFKLIVNENNNINTSELSFQALNENDHADWIRLLNAGKRYATLKAQHQPSSSPHSPASPVAFTRVFGVPISVVCEREGRDIPMVVEVLLAEIESRGLDEVGLYRVSGSLASVHALKAAFDSGEEVDMEDDRWFDINTIAGCFKLYLRELSEPLLTTELFPEFVQCGGLIDSANIKQVLKQLRICIDKLPSSNYNLLKRLLQHLGNVAQHEQNNKMKTPNLAIVFSMSFLPSSAVDQMKSMQNIVNTMIIHHNELFSDIPLEDSSDGLNDEELNNTVEDTTTTSTNNSATNSSTKSDGQFDDHTNSTNRDSFTEVSAY